MKNLKLFSVILMLLVGIGQMWATEYTATYTVASASSVNASGDYPDGSSATLTGSAGLNSGMLQLTYGKNAVLTISGYEGCTITGFKMSMKSNASKGKGSMTLVAGATTLHSVPDAAFNTSNWYGSWSTSAVDVDFTSVMTTDYTVDEDENIVITVTNHGTSNSTNSLYIGSYTITYEVSSSGGSTPSLSVSPTSWDFGEVAVSDEASKVFSVSGSNLTAGTLSISVPAGFSVSPSSISVTEATLAATNVTVSKNTTAIDDYSGNLSISATCGLTEAKTVALEMSVVADPEPTGTFEPFSGDIEEGDYLIVADGAGMNTTVSGNRLQYTALTLTGENYVNPDESVIWHIAESATAGYWTIYSGAESKYAAATGSNNQAQMLESGTDNKSLWEITHSEAVYTITNKSNSRFLKKNGTYGFACYADGTVSLYKKVDGTAKPSAGLAFDAAQKLAKVGGTLTAPNLSTADGFDGTVTYASSDEAVVKVNASTGAITEIVAVGKAVITAHSDETKNFKEGSASYTIFVAEQAGTNEDPLSEASAKALIDLGCEMEVHVHGTVLGSQDATKFTVTLAGGLQFYKLKDLGNVAFESAYIKNGDEVTAIGTLTKYNTTYELAEGCYLTAYTEYTEPLVDISNTKETAYTVAQALALATNPTSDLTKAVYIAGVVYDVKSFNSTNGTLDIYIKDAGEDNKFEFYKCAGIYDESLTVFTAADDVQVGDEVIGYGVMKYFSGGSIWEFDNTATGDYLVELTRPEVAVTGVTLESTASVAVGGTVTLHAAVVPENASNKTINWSVQSGNAYASVADGVVTGIAEGTAVIRAASDEDASIYAECTVTVAPLSPWATVYTSNITLSVDENDTKAYAEKVKITVEEELTEFSALRAATGSAAGECHVIVPAGTQTLHFHAAAWNGKASTVTVKMGETTLLEQALTSDAGIANSSPYTLSGNAYEYYYSIDLSGYSLAEETRITFSVGSDKRFVLFGVNQVGGLVLESISVSGTATALEYNDGDHFSPAGLSVIGHYSDASTAPISEGIDWAFDPDPLTEGTTSVSVTATAGGFTSDPFVVDGLTVAGAAPLSPWATTYTSNITLSVDENDTKAYAEKVKITVEEELTEFSALRAATGSAAGECHVIVPAGTQTLHFHAAAWNGKASTVTVKMGETTLLEQALTPDAGIANSSPYTLSGNAYEYYYSIDLSGYSLAEETRITFSVGSDKRFVLFGVNQEGGVVPVLKSIEISGDLTTKSGYKAGDALDLDGLAVSAIYTLNDVDQAPVDVTSLVNWSYDPLVEGQTSVTITATLEDKSDDITISDLEAVASADPKIYVDKLSVTFDPVVKDAALPANQTITVTLTNVAAATATLGGTNPDAFSIDPATLTESGDITISVIASTAAVATYSAKITITDDAAAASSKTVNLSFSVTAPDDDLTGTWNLVTDAADLKPGVQVMITGVKNDKTYAMAAQTSSNRTSVEGTLNGTVLTPNNGSKVFTLVDAANGKFALQTWQGEYLYASSSSANQLKTRADITADAIWTISLNTEDNTASIVAEESSNRNVMQFNNSSTNALFACYASASQSALKLYANLVKISDPTVDASTITNNTSVVVPNGTTLTSGADKTLRNVIIKEGGVMEATAGTLNVNDVTINSMAGKSGQVLGTNVNVTGNLYLEIKLRDGDMDAEASRLWYCISAPFDVNMNGGFFWGDGTPMVLNTHFQLFEYDGQKRADTGNGWKRVNGTMKANTAYFIGFDDAQSNQNTIKLKANAKTIPAVAPIALNKYSAADEANANWNAVANPTLRYVGLDKTVQVFDPEHQNYNPFPYFGAAYAFVVGTPFFYKGTGSIVLNTDHHDQYRAPQHRAESYNYCVQISKAETERFDNQLYVVASETAAATYEEGQDVPSMNEETSKYGALIWTENYGDKRLAIEEAPLVNSSASYVLGIYAPEDGEYTISTPQAKEDVSLYLTREGRVIWDLTAAPYTLDLTKGNTTGYGLRIVAAPKATTDLEDVQGDKLQCTKVLINNHVFILRSEQLYDATGRLVK